MLQVSTLKFKHQRGNVLLLALLLLAGGIVGGLTVAVLVVSEIRQARSLDNALIGYYDAEGGLEQSLYDIRQAQLCTQEFTGDDPCDANDFNTCQPNTNCKVKINPSSEILVPLISVDDTFSLDIEPGDGVTAIEVSWSPLDRDHLSYLEVSFLNIESLGGSVVVRPNLGVPYYCNQEAGYDEATNSCTLLLFSDSDGYTNSANSKTYQVRFKSLAYPINKLRIQPETPLGSHFSGYLNVSSRSQKINIRQQLTTSVPSQLPVYGFPDYVIFSEQDIVK